MRRQDGRQLAVKTCGCFADACTTTAILRCSVHMRSRKRPLMHGRKSGHRNFHDEQEEIAAAPRRNSRVSPDGNAPKFGVRVVRPLERTAARSLFTDGALISTERTSSVRSRGSRESLLEIRGVVDSCEMSCCATSIR